MSATVFSNTMRVVRQDWTLIWLLTLLPPGGNFGTVTFLYLTVCSVQRIIIANLYLL